MSLMLAFLMPVLGIGLAGMYLFQTLAQSVRGLMHLYQSAESVSAKRRILATVVCCVVGLVGGGTMLPVPGSVQCVGVVRGSEDQTVHASTPGFLISSNVLAGDHLSSGQTLCSVEQPGTRSGRHPEAGRDSATGSSAFEGTQQQSLACRPT
jgi:hypothetical protein